MADTPELSKETLRIVLFHAGMRGACVRDALVGAGYRVHEVQGVKDVNGAAFLDEMRKLEPSLFVVAGYPIIFKRPLLDIPKYGSWNCHAGPVPEYRGGSPLNWQIIDGRETIDVSLLYMDEGIDTGAIIAQMSGPLKPEETIADAHRMANAWFPTMVLDSLKLLLSDSLGMSLQPESDAYRRQRSDDDGEIDLSWDSKRIRNFIRALTHPYPGAWVRAGDGEKIRIWT